MSKRTRTISNRQRRKKQSPTGRGMRPSLASPQGLLREAMQAQAAGQLERARALFADVLATTPNDQRALFALGQITAQMGNLVEAVELVQRAINVEGPGNTVMYRVALADMLMENGQGEKALETAESAVADAEGDGDTGGARAYAHCILAACLERFHRIDEAITACELANALLPGDSQISAILGRLLRRAGRSEEAVTLLRTLAGRTISSWVTRKTVLHELGMALDKIGEYDEAYRAFEKYGSAMAASPTARRTDRRAVLEGIARFKKSAESWGKPICHAADFANAESTTDASADRVNRAPAFLVGFPRSGTTMTEQILAAHPAIQTADEWALISALGDEAGRRLGGHPQQNFEKFDLEFVRSLRQFYWDRVDEINKTQNAKPLGDRFFVDKLPLNIIDLALINRVFPDAPIIVALRDPRDVCLSCFIQDFGLNESMIQFLSLHNTVRFYDVVMDYYLLQRKQLNLKILEIHYEKTVADLEGQSRQLLEHLGVAWDPQVLKFHEAARSRFITTPSFEAVTQPVHQKAIGRWKNYRTAFTPELETLAPFVKVFGYTN